MRVAAVIEDPPANSYVKGEVFGSSLAAYSQFALYDLTSDQGPFRANAYTFIRLRPGSPVQQMQQELSAFAARNSTCLPTWVHRRTASDAHWRFTLIASW